LHTQDLDFIKFFITCFRQYYPSLLGNRYLFAGVTVDIANQISWTSLCLCHLFKALNMWRHTNSYFICVMFYVFALFCFQLFYWSMSCHGFYKVIYLYENILNLIVGFFTAAWKIVKTWLGDRAAQKIKSVCGNWVAITLSLGLSQSQRSQNTLILPSC